MSEIPVGEPLETKLEEPEGSLGALGEAADIETTKGVAADFPACLAAWAELGEDALKKGQAVQAYAYFRVGYHRGLDRLRQAGWRGQGRVPWSHEGNRGFLRSLRGLGEAAELIGETDEYERCRDFLQQLDPAAP